MTTYISILRGINVSGKNVIKMDTLKEMLAILDFKNIQTYIQSGNIIFASTEKDTRKLEARISTQIKISFGFDIPVIVLTLDTLKEIIANNPFVSTKDNAYLHVTFLAEEPKQYDQQILIDKAQADEEFLYSKSAINLYCPNGYGQTKLTNTFIENKLKVTATTRNWKTTNELLKIAMQ